MKRRRSYRPGPWSWGWRVALFTVLVFGLAAAAGTKTPELDARLLICWNDLRIPAEDAALLLPPGKEQILRLRGRDQALDLEIADCDGPGFCQGSGAVLGIRPPKKSGNYLLRVTVTTAPSGRRDDQGASPKDRPQKTFTLHLLVGFPGSALQDGRLNGFELGSYPVEKNQPWSNQAPAYFYYLDNEALGCPLSLRFKLGDLGYDGRAPLPQYFTLDYELVKKLELIADELEARGLPSRFHFIGGGFISPKSNRVRAGRNAAAANQSRHMWGEAIDFIIDQNPRDETMDDLNRDGRIDVRDAFVVRDLVTALEEAKRCKSGGFGVYSPPRNSQLTMHVDVRGYPTRWGYQEYDARLFSGVAPKKSLRPGGKR